MSDVTVRNIEIIANRRYCIIFSPCMIERLTASPYPRRRSAIASAAGEKWFFQTPASFASVPVSVEARSRNSGNRGAQNYLAGSGPWLAGDPDVEPHQTWASRIRTGEEWECAVRDIEVLSV